MILENQEEIRLLNTAVLKNKEKTIDTSFEKRLYNSCKKPAISALGVAISHLSETQNISRDQAALLIVEAIKELDRSWNDYLLMEGLSKIKENLKESPIS
jgi:hypothetical protein